MADQLGDLQVADFTNKKLKKKLVDKKFELKEEQKFTDDTIVDANKKITAMKEKLDKKKKEVKRLKKVQEAYFDEVKKWEKDYDDLCEDYE